jgi:hypothetical protein
VRVPETQNYKTMKKTTIFVVALVAAFFLGYAQESSGAVVFTSPTHEEAQGLLIQYAPAFVKTAQAGGTSGSQGNTHELEISATTVGEIGQVVWDYPDPVLFYHDNAGNIGVQVGPTVLIDQPLFPFTHLLVQVKDWATFPGDTGFRSVNLNGEELGDLVANEGWSYWLIDLGEESPEYQLTGEFSVGPNPGGGTDNQINVYGLNIGNTPPSVPEPTSSILLLLSLITGLLRRNR